MLFNFLGRYVNTTRGNKVVYTPIVRSYTVYTRFRHEFETTLDFVICLARPSNFGGLGNWVMKGLL